MLDSGGQDEEKQGTIISTITGDEVRQSMTVTPGSFDKKRGAPRVDFTALTEAPACLPYRRPSCLITPMQGATHREEMVVSVALR